MSEKWKKYEKFLYIMLAISCIALMSACYISFWKQIPSKMYLYRKGESELNFSAPVTVKTSAKSSELTSKVRLQAGSGDSYLMQVNLLGVMPVKKIDVKVVDAKKIYPLGIPVGMYLHTKGVLVLGCGEFKGRDGTTYAPANHILKEGDYIEKVNGIEVNEKEEVIDSVEKSGGKEVFLHINRQDEYFDVEIKPQLNQEMKYKIGVWVCDSVQGIGTLSYVETDGSFGALGHSISDSNDGGSIRLGYGALYETDIVSVKKGEKQHPGELTGVLLLKEEAICGDINRNNNCGVYGKIENTKKFQSYLKNPIVTGFKEEIKIGPAKILCKLDDESKLYDVDVIGINYDSKYENKDLEIVVTDQELLDKTGGIVQGMSGSPIIQNNKMIGVVTHVFVNDPKKGYGIFIEKMLSE